MGPKTSLIIFWLFVVQGSKKQYMKHLSAKKKGYGVCCVRRGLDLCRFPAKLANYSDMSAEVHVQAQIFPFFCSQVVFSFNLSRGAKKRRAKYLLQRT
jgi:hypothetical protein